MARSRSAGRPFKEPAAPGGEEGIRYEEVSLYVVVGAATGVGGEPDCLDRQRPKGYVLPITHRNSGEFDTLLSLRLVDGDIRELSG